MTYLQLHTNLIQHLLYENVHAWYKISLKSGPSAQLMSGGRNESRATFYTAVDKVGVVEDKFVKPLEDMVNNLAPSSVAASNLDQAIKDAKDKAVMTANAAHKLFKTDLQSYFNTNPDFADAFAYIISKISKSISIEMYSESSAVSSASASTE